VGIVHRPERRVNARRCRLPTYPWGRSGRTACTTAPIKLIGELINAAVAIQSGLHRRFGVAARVCAALIVMPQFVSIPGQHG